LKDEVWKPGRLPYRDTCPLVVAGVDGDVELSFVFRLEKADYPIVLELLR